MAVKRTGKKVSKACFPETEHCGLDMWATNCCAPIESGSVEDNHGSRALGPTAQRQRQ